jgi:quinol monooxygenase YgiN
MIQSVWSCGSPICARSTRSASSIGHLYAPPPTPGQTGPVSMSPGVGYVVGDRTFVYAKGSDENWSHLVFWSDQFSLPASQPSRARRRANATTVPLLISMVLLGAQAPPDGTAYSVAYVDILPASRAAAITALKQYRDASRKDDGFQGIEFFEQAGRSAHFCIIETWANGRDLDTHAASANAKDFRNKINSMRLSDYDQRPYKTLSLGTAQNDRSSRGTFVITHVDIGGQGTNATDLLRKVAEASRREEGNLPVRCLPARDACESFHGYRRMADRENNRDACGCDSHEGIPEQPWADRRQPSGRTSL